MVWESVRLEEVEEENSRRVFRIVEGFFKLNAGAAYQIDCEEQPPRGFEKPPRMPASLNPNHSSRFSAHPARELRRNHPPPLRKSSELFHFC
jgi:hypothetical protein